MKISLPPKHYLNGFEDREFLSSLDKRLHYVDQWEAIANLSLTRHKVSADLYNKNEKITTSELEKIIEMIGNETGLALTPINTDMGFSVGFAVYYSFDKKLYLAFLEKQLPEGFNFNSLEPVFNSVDNVALLAKIGIEKPEEYWHYEY